ncbi:farnesyl pyrophosphate synthetase [Aspergillus sclerotioniger CBS 115572]|uniref:Farnesyl pyrophosphate synthetase n=1 Tax=Aspergillus sclerotioniger CBS 115572 TaxID=1450535 RepID=A0A317VLM6_9EURO|nr:farnesyl pyrophosphate synthetase [Aspergillus sclerotioniger CBS 115572]PWY75273.1 farnesyl pyrophosphate synthetase [Aspergillus sclerotioniger CBS 115572]
MDINPDRFESIFPTVLEDALSYAKSIHTPPEALSWLRKNITHNTTSGKHLRGLLIPNTYARTLSRPLTSPEYTLAAKLGWLVEFLQASFLVPDDIEDHDTFRRGKPSWHAIPGVGLKAINDAALLQSIVYSLLKRYLKGKSGWYVDVVELFQEVVFRTELGQMVDLVSVTSRSSRGRDGKGGVHGLTKGKCETIARMKTAYYSVYAPVAVGLYLGGVATGENLERMRGIAVRLGMYYQVQDDYLDSFGERGRLGKEVGRDIKDGKCSWLIVEALKMVDAGQRAVLEEWYGQGEGEGVERVQGVFREVGMERAFREFEEGVIGEVRRDVEGIDESSGLRKGIFVDIIDIMYRRDK